MTYSIEIQEAKKHLDAFSADIIASLTLVQNYDLKKIAYDIDLILKELEYIPSDDDD